MKKNFKTILFVLCLVSVLIATALIAYAELNSIENLYKQGFNGTAQSTATEIPSENNYQYYTSGLIEVVAGDKITVGPILSKQEWIIRVYDQNGDTVSSESNVAPSACDKVDTVCGNATIVTYTVPDGVASLRITTSQMFFDCTLITKNRSFTKDEYFAFMDTSGINVDFLRPVVKDENLVNLFPKTDSITLGKYKNGKLVTDNEFCVSDYISAKAGDVIYFAAVNNKYATDDDSQNWAYSAINIADSNDSKTTVSFDFAIKYEDLGRNYSIYAYRVRPDTTKISIALSRVCYDDGITFVTKNQPFTADAYREAVGVDLNATFNNTDVDKNSPLYGLTGLFMGDSISYGLDDMQSYADNPDYCPKGWAGRIAKWTGLRATNASVSGATAAYHETASKWLFNQHTAYVGQSFDLIVMQGGVNDARNETPVGAMLPIDSPTADLEAATDTYIGGLQWLFHNVKKSFADSKLFFITNHHLDGHSKGNAKDMSAYFDAAKTLCEAYGIHVIDLYNNTELNETLATETNKYLIDTLHLKSAGYDIVTPYILNDIEAVMEQSVSQKIYYKENFDGITQRVDLVNGENTGVADGWTFVKASDTAKAYIEDGKLHLYGNKYDMVFRTGESWTNYTLEADIYYKSSTASAGWLGMLYNVVDQKNFQKAGLNPNKKYSLNGKVDGSWKNNTEGINTGFKLGDDVSFGENVPFRLKVVTYNNSAILYYALLNEDSTMKTDYVKLLTIDNIPAETRSGSIGFMTSTTNLASVWVDNIKVSETTASDLVLLAPNAAEIYVPETGIVNPPVVVERLGAQLPNATGERAAVVIAQIDENLNVLDKNGNILITAEEFIKNYRLSLIPAFLIDSKAEADALAEFIEKNNLTDAYVVADSENADLVKRVRMTNATTELITGALIFNDLNSAEARSEARELVVDNMSYVAISTEALSEETAFYFAARQIAVWGFANSTKEVYRGIANGYHGIVSENSALVYDVYESITAATVSGRTVVIAHRGVNMGADIPYPENTLMAIKAAKEVYGADCVEIDFGLTKDGYVILMHDSTLDRTTNGKGNFSDFTLEEIKALTVDIVPGKETTVPTLEEALILAKELDIVLYCHVKTNTDENIAAFSYLVEKHDCADRVLLFTSSLEKYNSNVDRVVSGTAYELSDSPVIGDGIQFTSGNKTVLESYDKHIDGIVAMRKCLNKYNFQPLFYPYSEQGAIWADESFYYQLSARGLVNMHSVTNGQDYMDSTALTGSGAVGWLTNNPHLCDDYHYAVDLGTEKLNLKIGESIDLTKVLKLIVGTENGKASIIQLSGPDLNSANTLSSEGTVTIVYAVTRKTEGGTIYTVYSEPVDIKFGPEKITNVKTPYGTISEEYADAAKYPFVVFDADGNFYKGYETWVGTNAGALGGAYNLVNKNVWDETAGKYTCDGGEGKKAIIYLRRDYAMSTSDVKFDNFGYIKGEVTLDLGGHTLSQGKSSAYVFSLQSKGSTPNTLNVKNGTVLATTKRLIQVYSTSGGSVKNINVNFYGVTLGVEKGSSISALFFSNSRASGNTNVCHYYVTFNDCIFDFESASSGSESFTIFPKTANYCSVAVTVNGGEFRFGTNTNITISTADFAYDSSTTFDKGGNEKYPTLSFSGETVTTESLSTEEGSMKFVKVDDGKYTLASVANPYGEDIPQEYGYAEKYPFIVLDQNGSFLAAYDTLYGSNSGMAGKICYTHLNDGSTTGCIVLMRRDYTLGTGEYFNNWAAANGTVIFDLCGYSINQQSGSRSDALFKLTGKKADGKVFPTTISVKNGSINMYLSTVVSMDCYGTDPALVNKLFTFTFDNVKFGLTKGATLSTLLIHAKTTDNGAYAVPFVITYNGCEFDLATNSNGKVIKLFNNNATAAKHVSCTVNVNGGVIKALSADLVDFWNLSDPDNSSVIFGKGSEGYIKLMLPADASAPSAVFPTDNGSYVFARTADLGDIAVYEFEKYKPDNIDFVPKMSLTLDRNLILNVYIPISDSLLGFTLDGKESGEYEISEVTLGTERYYRVSIPLDAKEAFRSIVLQVRINVGEKTATGIFSFGVIKYAEKVLEDGSEVEKTLVKDVLSYVRAAYVYFKVQDAESIAKVNEILGENYDENNMPEMNGSTNSKLEGFESTTLVLDATPAIRFTLVNGADAGRYEFFINGEKVKGEVSADGSYIDLDVYAYALCETVTYTVDGVEKGSYHINAYYEWSKTQSYEGLENLVARFAKYCESAAVYRNYYLDSNRKAYS